jgi:signal peptidase I
VYGAWQLRGLFGDPFGHPLANALLPYLLLCLPLVVLAALFEFRGHKLSRLVEMPVATGESPWVSTLGFGLLGVGWVFVRGGLADRDAAKAESSLAKPATQAADYRPSPGREAVETVVFVVVLVLMLKLFVVEAFVIPTGSMAETLYGYKKLITCPECGHEFPVNASEEADPTGGKAQETTGFCCPNCRYQNPTGAKDKKFDWSSGDRVLVSKFLGVNRGDVVVFKFPDAPQTRQTAQNYIKRLVGMPSETIAIFNGDLYATTALKYPADTRDADGQPLYPRPEDDHNLWRAPFQDQYQTRWTGPDFRYANAKEATDLFEESRRAGFTAPEDKGFRLIRKPDDQLLAMRRIVYDNDHPSKNLTTAGAAPRWQPIPDAGTGWKPDNDKAPKQFTHAGGEFGWLRYQHLVPTGGRFGWSGTAQPDELKAQPITNFLGYNAGFQDGTQGKLSGMDRWTGDLILDCTATVDTGGAVVLQLSKGSHSYRAEFDGGKVRIKMFPNEPIGPDGLKRETKTPPVVPVGDDPNTLATADSGLKAGTAHRLRFANVDGRLRVWVDSRAIDFGGKADYAPPASDRDTAANPWSAADVDRPACIGASGTAAVSGLSLWRDTYYMNNTTDKLDTYYVQPGHYLCMGDNSSQSSDGRMWGLVPDRLMLGRALFIFYPFNRVGFIR